jgi:hypothetical protein
VARRPRQISRWGSRLDIEHPVSGEVRLKKQQDLPVAGSAAVTEAAEAASAAVEAALAAAVATARPEDGTGGDGNHSPNAPGGGAAVDT